jgi:hypothetical protein
MHMHTERYTDTHILLHKYAEWVVCQLVDGAVVESLYWVLFHHNRIH